MCRCPQTEMSMSPLRRYRKDRYEVAPWPFYGESLQVSFEGRYMQPAASGTKTAPEASALPMKNLL